MEKGSPLDERSSPITEMESHLKDRGSPMTAPEMSLTLVWTPLSKVCVTLKSSCPSRGWSAPPRNESPPTQPTDGGPPAALELSNDVAGPLLGAAPGSVLISCHNQSKNHSLGSRTAAKSSSRN